MVVVVVVATLVDREDLIPWEGTVEASFVSLNSQGIAWDGEG